MTPLLFKALGALLAYPTTELVKALPEIDAVFARDKSLSRTSKSSLAALVQELAASDLLDAEARYVEVFDRGRRTSLHLFEHVHGDSRDRGQAMVDLMAAYAKSGYAFATNDLPDYLPAVLEFASIAPEAGKEMLVDCAHIVRAVGEALRERHSPYHAIPAAILDALGEAPLAKGTKTAAGEEKTLDEEWAEEQVVFGPAAACAPARPAVSVMQFVPRRT